jgi:hypothetical protein
MGSDLYARALKIAVSAAPPDVGVAIFAQIATAPPVPGQNGASGPVPVWTLVMTMPNPAELTGLQLRAMRGCGNGAPDFANLVGLVKQLSAELHELSRAKLREAQSGTG